MARTPHKLVFVRAATKWPYDGRPKTGLVDVHAVREVIVRGVYDDEVSLHGDMRYSDGESSTMLGIANREEFYAACEKAGIDIP